MRSLLVSREAEAFIHQPLAFFGNNFGWRIIYSPPVSQLLTAFVIVLSCVLLCISFLYILTQSSIEQRSRSQFPCRSNRHEMPYLRRLHILYLFLIKTPQSNTTGIRVRRAIDSRVTVGGGSEETVGKR